MPSARRPPVGTKCGVAEAIPDRTLHASATRLLSVAESMFAVDVLSASVVIFELPTVLAGDSRTVNALAAEVGITERACAVATDLLEAYGAVERTSGGRLSLTQVGQRYLLRSSPTSLIPIFEPLTMRDECQQMADVMRGIRHGSSGKGPELDWAAGMSQLDFARLFLRSTDARNRLLADALTSTLVLSGDRLLDIAGGSGIYACALLDVHPMLTAIVYEQEPVDLITRETIQNWGFDDRATVLTGDVFSSNLPAGFSDVLLSNVVHDWAPDQVHSILEKAFRCLDHGGQVIIHDMFVDSVDVGDCTAAAEYSALLMKFTDGRCYAYDDIAKYLTAIGFEDIQASATVAHRHLMTARRK